ncbi:putative membrane protein [Mucilaginibacter sp. UYP25]|uniref:hypothetical protein n=1 Tax=unclassified Mucilaginibacter TaxID=2617802 RepID=UPI0033941E66
MEITFNPKVYEAGVQADVPDGNSGVISDMGTQHANVGCFRIHMLFGFTDYHLINIG